MPTSLAIGRIEAYSSPVGIGRARVSDVSGHHRGHQQEHRERDVDEGRNRGRIRRRARSAGTPQHRAATTSASSARSAGPAGSRCPVDAGEDRQREQ